MGKLDENTSIIFVSRVQFQDKRTQDEDEESMSVCLFYL